MVFVDPSEKDFAAAPQGAESKRQPWNRAKLLLGMRVFVALTLAVVFVLFIRGNLKENLGAFLAVSPFALWVGLSQSVIDLVGGGARLWLVTRAFGSRMALSSCVRANGAGIFVAGLTPSQTGGGPAQIYSLAHAGAGFPVALVSSFLAYVCTIVVLLSFGIVMAWSGPPSVIGDGYTAFLRLGAALLGSFLLFLLLALPRPGIYHAALQRLFARVPQLRKRIGAGTVLAKVGYTLDTSSSLLRRIKPRDALFLLGGVGMTVIVYLNKLLVAYFVMRAMGLEVGLLEVIFLQWVLYLVLYFAPTPGASGLAELSAAAIMGAVVPSANVAAFVVLWRVFSLYLPMALGGSLLLWSLRESERRDGPPARYAAERIRRHSLSGGD